VLSKEADGLISGFYCLNHVPYSSVFSYEICFSKLSSLVVSLTFSCLNNISEVLVLQGIFSLVLGRLLLFLLVVILVSSVLVRLRCAGDRVAVHVVVELIFHLFLNRRLTALRLDRSELGRVDDAWSCLAGDLI